MSKAQGSEHAAVTTGYTERYGPRLKTNERK